MPSRFAIPQRPGTSDEPRPARAADRRPIALFAGVRVAPTDPKDGRSGRGARSSGNSREWQQRVADAYHLVGEVRYAARFLAKLVSRVEFFVAETQPDGKPPKPVSDPAIAGLLNDFQDAAGGRSRMLGNYVRLKFLFGEAMLLGTKKGDAPSDPTGDPQSDGGEWAWEIISTRELVPSSTSTTTSKGPKEYKRLRLASGKEETLNVASDPAQAKDGEIVVYRLWTPDPEHSDEPDSPMRSVLEVVEELVALTRAVRVRALSRLFMAGILKVPDTLVFGGPGTLGDGSDDDTFVDPDGVEHRAPPDDADPESDPDLVKLADATMEAIGDETSAAALVPMFVRGPAEALKALEHMQIFNPADTYPETGLRTEALERFANGVDLPREVVVGLQDLNHWNAWMVDEMTWKAHGQEYCEDFCDDIGEVLLRPRLRALNLDEDTISRYVIGYNAKSVTVRPNRERLLFAAFDRLAISWPYFREQLDIPETAKPDDAEIAERIAIYTKPRAGGDPEKDAPKTGEAAAEGIERLAGAVMLSVVTARERAGNRLRQAMRGKPEHRSLAKTCEGLPSHKVAWRLGPLASSALGGNGRPLLATELVDGSTGPLAEALEAWSVPEHVSAHLCSWVESFAARTLFDPDPVESGDVFEPQLAVLLEEAAGIGDG